MSRWLITGASSGLGHALAEHVLAQGDQVVLAARTTAPMEKLAADHSDRALVVALDVTDAEQRANALRRAEERFGGVDVLVNNAGIDYVGAIEEQDEKDYRAQFEVNFFAAVEMLRLLLPGMRERGSGTIVNVSSMDGISSLPGNGYYSATKFALEGVTEALWQEIEPLGLRALLVEPGSFRTGIERRTLTSGPELPAYEASSGTLRAVMQDLKPEQFPGDPNRAAAVIYETVNSDEPRHWLVLGSDAYRRVTAKVAMQTAEIESGRELSSSTDYPDQTHPPVL